MMSRCVELYNQYRYKSQITNSHYIDPMGFEYAKSIVKCRECIFMARGGSSCVLYKERGMDSAQIEREVQKVTSCHFCDFFLIENFSEGDSDDEKVRNEVLEIDERLGGTSGRKNYPSNGKASKKKSNHCFCWLLAIGGILWFLSR